MKCQILFVSIGDNLHKISNIVFWKKKQQKTKKTKKKKKKKKQYFIEMFTQSAKR